MALVSPGVQVIVDDQSQYIPSAVGTVPYVLLVTAQDKLSGQGVGIAPGTTKANAKKLNLMTSQRDLLATYGSPTFYNTGDEINEYGLLAAYSALGLSSLCYIQRADIDLNALKGSLVRPTGSVTANDYYFNTDKTTWGLTTWDSTTQDFTYQEPLIIVNPQDIYSSQTSVDHSQHEGAPVNTLGVVGDTAVVVVTDISDQGAQNIVWQKVKPITNYSDSAYYQADWYTMVYPNTWQAVGSFDWQWTIAPTIVGEWIPAGGNPESVLGPVYDITFNGNTYSAIDAALSNELQVNQWNQAFANEETGIYAAYEISSDATQIRYLIYANGASNTTVTIGDSVHYALDFGGTSASDALTLEALGLTAGKYLVPQFVASPSYQPPQWTAARTNVQLVQNAPTGSVWQVTNPVEFNGIKGLNLHMEQFNEQTQSFFRVPLPVYADDADALANLSTDGGLTILPGTLYAQPRSVNWIYDGYTTDNASMEHIASIQFFKRSTVGKTEITGTIPTDPFNYSTSTEPISNTNIPLWIKASEPGNPNWVGSYTSGGYMCPAPVFCPGTDVAAFVQGINDAAVPNVYAYVDADGAPVITHLTGGSIWFGSGPGPAGNDNLTTAGYGYETLGIRPQGNTLYNGNTDLPCIMSNWVDSPDFTYYLEQGVDVPPPNDTLWYWSDPTQADIMIQNNGAWVGYKTCDNDVRGYNLTQTNSTGPIFSASAPTTQTNGNALVNGDLWIDTSDLENYPKLYRWQPVASYSEWIQINLGDHQSANGILFADARWAPNGTTNPITDPIPSIVTMLYSSYLDLDAPNPLLYPQGTLLWNTRRSGYNVKSYQSNYFRSNKFPNQQLPAQTATWLSVSGLKTNGAAYMGRLAQRSMIVQALKSCIDTSEELRSEYNQYSLISCPQYPELAINMVALNNERGNLSLVLIDTPLRLKPSDIVTWATNNGGLGLPTGDGLATRDPYAATWYPSCVTTDLTGKEVVQPPSHMMLRTILNSDRESYPWFAPSGAQRGSVSNAYNLGYINAQTNAFVSLGVNQGIRDVLYTNSINPITYLPSSGIVNFGNKTTTGITTALDRINVARLVNYLRGRLKAIGDLYVFEPNDQITRNSIANVTNSLMIDLVAKRAIYDYLVICDASNNTPARIDRNELWMDVAIQPVKSIEFIYIPLRIKNTGPIAS